MTNTTDGPVLPESGSAPQRKRRNRGPKALDPSKHPADWHRARAEAMLAAHPEIKDLFGQDPVAIVLVVVAPSLHLATAIASSFFDWWWAIAAAYVVGAWCLLAMFSNMHELCHGVVHRSLRGARRTWAQRLVGLPDLGGELFVYFEHGHLPHHTRLGEHSRAEAERAFIIPIDLDVKSQIGNFYDIQPRANEPPTRRLDAVPDHPLTRIGVTVVLPVLDLLETVFIAPVTNARRAWAMRKELGITRKTQATLPPPKLYTALASVTGQNALWFAVVTALVVAFGWVPLLYLTMANLFFRGFAFHPALAYWVAVHHTDDSKAYCQPTSSIYGLVAGPYFSDLNLHIEHHDFPAIPRRSLRRLRQIAPEFYDDVATFRGIAQTLRSYVFDRRPWVYGCHGRKKVSTSSMAD